MILDWKKCASELLNNIRKQILQKNVVGKPMLVDVLVWDNPASVAYIRMKEKRAHEVGMAFQMVHFPVDITQEELENQVKKLSKDPNIHGLIVQAPLPKHIDTFQIIECIDPAKDVDGFSRMQIGNVFLWQNWLWSCTPKGIMTLLAYYDISVSGKKVVVLGRSNIVGKPMSLMLINAWATVTTCNSKTENLSEITKKADIIIVAIWSPKFLTRDIVNEGSIVIDVGSNRLDDGSFCGDADFVDLSGFVSAISPSPGWVGPMTVATLIENTWSAYQLQNRI